MEKFWLLGTLVLVSISNAQALTVLDEHYLIGLRDLYKFANLAAGEQRPYAVLALDFAGYKDLPQGFQRPNSPERFVRNKAELWPCSADFSWIPDAETTVIGSEDFSNGLLTYNNLLKTYKELLRLRRPGPGVHKEVHIFFSHLPSPSVFHAISETAKRMPHTTFTIGYYNSAPEVSGFDMTQHLHETALEILNEHSNINFGRIDGNEVDGAVVKSELNACYLNAPAVKKPGYPQPEVFLAKRKSENKEGVRVKSEFRYKPFKDWAVYFCQLDGNTQVATREQLKRSANNGYKFPCSWQADGVAREVVETCDGKLEVRVCDLESPREAYIMCSGKKASVEYIERSKTGTSENILGEGNQECMNRLETYLIGVKHLEEAVANGYYNGKCAYTTDGKRYKISRVDGSLNLVECSDEEPFGFYCNLEKPEVFRSPTERDAQQTLFASGEAANDECRSKGFHMATLKQLRDAWIQGLDYCDCGHLRCGAIHYPINNPRKGCELSSAGLRPCPADPREWSRSGYAAYCSRAELPIVEQKTESTDWRTAMNICKEQGLGLARFDQYTTASINGFRDHRCLMSANGQSYTFGDVVASCSNPTNFYCTRYNLPVFHINGNKFSTIEEAEQGCREKGSTLATEDLLELAYQLGYDHCSCGFLRGGKVKYPVNRPRPECGGPPGPGLRDCPAALRGKGFDAYCVAF